MAHSDVFIQKSRKPCEQIHWPRKGGFGIACCGIWCLHVWMFFIAHLSAANTPSPRWLNLYLVLSVALVVVAFLAFRLPTIPWNKANWPFAVAGLAGTMMLAIGVSVSNLSVLYVTGLVVGGCSLAWGYLGWIAFFAQLDARSTVWYLFLACILGSVAKAILSFFPESIAYMLCAGFPVASYVFLSRAIRKHLPKRTSKRVVLYSNLRDFKPLWKVAFTIVLYTFACTCIAHHCRMTFLNSNYSMIPLGLGRILEIILCLAILYWVFIANGTLGFSQLWGTVTVLTATSLLSIALGLDVAIGYALVGVAIDIIVAYFWLAIADAAHHSSLHPFTLFGFSWLLYTVPRFLGDCFMDAFPSLLNSELFSFGFLYIIVVTMVTCLGSRNPYVQRIFSDLDDTDPAPKDFALIDERCEAFASTHDLTPRETEIMKLLCKGKSKVYIAETLFITENTVKGHCKRLYAKTNVHSKRELQSLIGL